MKLTGVLLFLPLVLASPATARADATVLYDIEIVRADRETEVHLKADGPIRDYGEFKLKKNLEANRPERMYLDLGKVRLAAPLPAREAGTALARVRTGKRGDGVRVVFDSNLAGLFDYTIRERPDGLLVTIREPAASPIREDKSATGPGKVMAPALETIYPQPKAAGDLKLVIATSDSPDHAREWVNAPPDNKTGLTLLKRAKPDQEISISFLVTGLSPDRAGNFSYQTSFTLLDPFGNPKENRRHYAKATVKAPAHPVFILAEPELTLVPDSSDPIGDYRIIGMVEDLTNNKISRASKRITLTR
ncbi:MAG: AMIN domain-containing protein [Desulfobulbales bacterium]|nr:AMIN domain-containing protein [Desulfobulbales bacterium]